MKIISLVAFMSLIISPLALAKTIKFHHVNKSCSMGFKVKKKIEYQICDDANYRVWVSKSDKKSSEVIAADQWSHIIKAAEKKLKKVADRKIGSTDKKSKKKGERCMMAFYVGNDVYAKCGNDYLRGLHGQNRKQMQVIHADAWKEAFRTIAKN